MEGVSSSAEEHQAQDSGHGRRSEQVVDARTTNETAPNGGEEARKDDVVESVAYLSAAPPTNGLLEEENSLPGPIEGDKENAKEESHIVDNEDLNESFEVEEQYNASPKKMDEEVVSGEHRSTQTQHEGEKERRTGESEDDAAQDTPSRSRSSNDEGKNLGSEGGAEKEANVPIAQEQDGEDGAGRTEPRGPTAATRGSPSLQAPEVGGQAVDSEASTTTATTVSPRSPAPPAPSDSNREESGTKLQDGVKADALPQAEALPQVDSAGNPSVSAEIRMNKIESRAATEGEAARAEEDGQEGKTEESGEGDDVKRCEAKTENEDGEEEVEEEGEDDGRGPPPPKGSEVFVGGLHREATEDDVRELRLMRDPKTGVSKGYAFVRYTEPTFAELAADQLNGYLVMGRPIGVLVSQDNQSLFVGHISKDWSLDQLESHLKTAGIQGVHHIIFQKKNRGFAFVEFRSHHQAARAHGKMNRSDFRLGQQKVRVDWAEPLNEPGEGVMAQVKSIYVANLPLDVDNELITSLFAEYGKVERIVLSKNLPTARRKDFAFVNYEDRESALKAIEGKHGFDVQGRTLEVTLAKPVDDGSKQQGINKKKGTGGGGGGWRGGAPPADRMDGRRHSDASRAAGDRDRDARHGMRGDRMGRGGGMAGRTTGRRMDTNRGMVRDGRGPRGGAKQMRSPQEDEYPYGYESDGLPSPGLVPLPPELALSPVVGGGMLPLPPSPGGGGGVGFRCELCNLVLNSENQLHQHYQGRQHFKAQQLQQQQQQQQFRTGYPPAGYGGPPIMPHQSFGSPSSMGKRKRMPPAGHQGFARNPRQRSDDYDALPPYVDGSSPYEAAPSSHYPHHSPHHHSHHHHQPPPPHASAVAVAAYGAAAPTGSPPVYYTPPPPSAYSAPPPPSPAYYGGGYHGVAAAAYGATYPASGGGYVGGPTTYGGQAYHHVYAPHYAYHHTHHHQAAYPQQAYAPYAPIVTTAPSGAGAGVQRYGAAGGYEHMQWS